MRFILFSIFLGVIAIGIAEPGLVYAQGDAMLLVREGQVSLRRAGSTAWEQLTSLETTLNGGDELKTGRGGRFVIIYINRTSERVERKGNQSYIIASNQDKDQGVLTVMERIFTGAVSVLEDVFQDGEKPTGGVRRSEEEPVLTVLRRGKLLATTPTISWIGPRGAYSVQIETVNNCLLGGGESVVWQENGISGFSISPPQGSVSLNSGLRYRVTVSTRNALTTVSDDGCFQAASDAEQQAAEAVRAQINQTYSDSQDANLFYAAWLADNTFYTDALYVINQVKETDSTRPILFKLKAYIYGKAGPTSFIPDPCDRAHVHYSEACKGSSR